MPFATTRIASQSWCGIFNKQQERRAQVTEIYRRWWRERERERNTNQTLHTNCAKVILINKIELKMYMCPTAVWHFLDFFELTRIEEKWTGQRRRRRRHQQHPVNKTSSHRRIPITMHAKIWTKNELETIAYKQFTRWNELIIEFSVSFSRIRCLRERFAESLRKWKTKPQVAQANSVNLDDEAFSSKPNDMWLKQLALAWICVLRHLHSLSLSHTHTSCLICVSNFSATFSNTMSPPVMTQYQQVMQREISFNLLNYLAYDFSSSFSAHI